MSPSSADRRERFRALYDANFRPVLGYALRRTDQPEDAADVVAEVFLVAWRRFEDLPPGDARPWLFGVARHVLANHRRTARRRTDLAARLRDRLHRQVAPDPAAGVAEHDEIRAALNGLGADDRELLTLVAWDGLAPHEIAEVMGIPPGTVRQRLLRARRRFAARLGDAGVPAGHLQSVHVPLEPEEER